MKKKEINITIKADGTKPYLSEVLKEIPSNTIINKTICGCGVTYLELTAPRHSLILEDYKTVCLSKQAKHKGVLAVVKGVTVDDIVDYIFKTIRRKAFLKIITVPENLNKIDDALGVSGMSITRDVFFLYDECQTPVKDASWRPSMVDPMDLFFNSLEKAMVSATPLRMSDPRFKQQGFTELVITPEWESKVDVTLVTTNNVLASFGYKLLLYAGAPMVLIGCKSVTVIKALIRQLNIEKKSAIFCAQESADNLKAEGFKKVYTQISEKDMMKYNFCTSRFFDAVDIDLSFKPDVFMVSDVVSRPHTMIDPVTEAYQWAGRCRQGINSFTVVTNGNRNFPDYTSEKIKAMLDEHRFLYQTIQTMMVTNPDQHMRAVYSEILQSFPYASLLGRDGETEYFFEDNWIHEMELKCVYSDTSKIISAYRDSGKFNVDVGNEYFPYSDYQRLRLERTGMSKSDARKIIVEQLDQLQPVDTPFKGEVVEDFRKYDAEIVEAYELIGADAIRKHKFSISEIRKAVAQKKVEMNISSDPFKQLVTASFQTGEFYSAKEIKAELKKIYSVLKVTPDGAITARNIEKSFNCRRITRKIKGKSTDGYIIDSLKF